MNAFTRSLITTFAAAGLLLSAPAFASTTAPADALCGGAKDVKKPTDDDGKKKTKNPASVELCGGGKDVKKPTDDDGKKKPKA